MIFLPHSNISAGKTDVSLSEIAPSTRRVPLMITSEAGQVHRPSGGVSEPILDELWANRFPMRLPESRALEEKH
jgi:hypothetical protein